MIPSTTKLALLSGILLLADFAVGLPVTYDQRQEGKENLRADLENIVLAVFPSEGLISGLDLIDFRSIRNNRPRYQPQAPTKTASKMGFIRPEKSPYKVDLEHSKIPVSKLHMTTDSVEKLNSESKHLRETLILSDSDEGEIVIEPGKTVKKDLKPAEIDLIVEKSELLPEIEIVMPKKLEEKKKTEKEEKEEKVKKEILKVEKQKKEPSENKGSKDDRKVKSEEVKPGPESEKVVNKRDNAEEITGDQLKLIGEGIEQCGPGGKRDETGKCVF